MRITKYGHCCLLVEIDGLRILTDPGMFSTGQNDATDIDVILITHEHGDHCHAESVQAILRNNPQAVVVTNAAVGKLLDGLGVAYEKVEEGGATEKKGVSIEGVGNEHAAFYEGIPNVQNTGYVVQKKLYFPGDAFAVPGHPVDVLALPVAGPWMKFSEAVDFARAVQPKTCFPVHEAIMVSSDFLVQRMAPLLQTFGIAMESLKPGETKEF
jgi:L-ascorbate metabolism protein UlaG (beta-lactamase superfamily)